MLVYTAKDDYKTPKSPLIRQAVDGHDKLIFSQRKIVTHARRTRIFSFPRENWGEIFEKSAGDRWLEIDHLTPKNCEWGSFSRSLDPSTVRQRAAGWKHQVIRSYLSLNKTNTKEFQQRMKKLCGGNTERGGFWQMARQ